MSSGETSGISKGTNGTQSSLEQMNMEIKAMENEEKLLHLQDVPIRRPKDLRYSRKKTEEYLLNINHPQGGSEAKFFEDILGYSKTDAHKFHKAVVQAVIGRTPYRTQQTEYGIKHTFNSIIKGNNGRYITANIVVVIQKDNHRTTYKIITVYPGRKD